MSIVPGYMQTPQTGLIPNFSQMMGQSVDPQVLASFMPQSGSTIGGISGAGGGLPQVGRQSGLGFNVDTLGLGLSGLATLGSLWSAFQSNKLAKEQFNFSKDFAEKNMANQTQAYNTALGDRSRSRAAVEGQSKSESDAWVSANRLNF